MEVHDIEQLLEILTFKPLMGRTDALRFVVDAMSALGGAVGIVCPGASPNILVSYGETQKITTNKEVWRFFCDCFNDNMPIGEYKSALIELPERTVCLALRLTEVEIIGVVLWVGPKSKVERECLQRLFLKLMAAQLIASRQFEQKAARNLIHLPDFPPGYIVGCSPAITLLHRDLRLLSRGTFPVLILGETGVGKDYIANILHGWSDKRKGPFIAVNCAAVPHELWEAEMFGIGRGVATGVQEREGYFQRAHGGTIFLDEIGELTLSAQAKLLRVLQNQIVQRVGGAQTEIDVRILAATNMDLLQLVEQGSYRADLYYRLAGATLNVPSLCERREDIPLLLQYFLNTAADQAAKTVKGFSLDVFEALNDYAWPGNIREMENEVRRLVYLCPEGQEIDSSLLSKRITQTGAIGHRDFCPTPGGSQSLNLSARLAELERNLVKQALLAAKGNRTIAAKLLGVTRSGLSMKMERLAIEV